MQRSKDKHFLFRIVKDVQKDIRDRIKTEIQQKMSDAMTEKCAQRAKLYDFAAKRMSVKNREINRGQKGCWQG